MNATSPPSPPTAGAFDPKLQREDNGKLTLITGWTLLVISGGFLGLRLYAKLSRGRRLWFDDGFLIVSWALMLGNVGIVAKMVTIGYGKHVMFIDPALVPDLTLFGNITLTFTVTALSWSKTSFAITLLRVTQRWSKKAVWFVIVSTNLLFFWTGLVHWVYCSPVAKTWNPFLDGKCWSYATVVAFDILAGAYSSAMDFALSLLAWYTIKDLVMKKREKIGVIASMSLGALAGVVAIVKCTYLPTMLDMDAAYTGSYLTIWGEAEIAATIVASSVPVLRALVAEKSSMAKSKGTAIPRDLWPSEHLTLHDKDATASDVALQQVKHSGRSTPEFVA